MPLIFVLSVPSVDSGIPVTIQPVVTDNMVEITVLLNVSKRIVYTLYIISVYNNYNYVFM